jgi:predicted Zn-dependent protease
MSERAINLLYGLGQRRLPLRHRLAGELDKIKYSKREKNFDRALRQVNELLAKEPEFPEALFLKAQILWEGFGNQAAEGYLKKVLRLVKVGEPLHRWALSYHEQVRRL